MTTKNITVVSGLPRSGTSMMMQTLVAGGLKALTDQQRMADSDNPAGYLELEAVKQLPRGEDAFLAEAQDKVIKVIHALLMYLPARYRYQVVFIHRNLGEVVASQKIMLERRDKVGAALSESQLISVLEKQRDKALIWLRAQSNCEVIEIKHAEVISDPQKQMERINSFLGGQLDVQAMAGAVNPALHRHKSEG